MFIPIQVVKWLTLLELVKLRLNFKMLSLLFLRVET